MSRCCRALPEHCPIARAAPRHYLPRHGDQQPLTSPLSPSAPNCMTACSTSSLLTRVVCSGDGEVLYDELWEWVRGRRHPLDARIDRTTKRVRDVIVEAPTGASFTLSDVEWNEPVLRAMIWRALEVAKVSTLDLVRVSCKGTGAFLATPAVNKAEFIRMVHRLLRGVDKSIWHAEIAPLVEAIFPVVAGAHDNIGGILSKKIDVRECERWLRGPDDEPPGLHLSPPLKRKASPLTLQKQCASQHNSPPHTTQRVSLSPSGGTPAALRLYTCVQCVC